MGHNETDPHRRPPRRANAEILATFGGGASAHLFTLDIPPGTSTRLEHAVIGFGATIDEIDMNANFSLAGGRYRDAARMFRARMYHRFGLTPPRVRRRVSSEGRSRDSPLRGLLVGSTSHFGTASVASAAVATAGRLGVMLVHFSGWGDVSAYPAGPARFREHLRLLATIDIHISGPGTTCMYQQLLPDGSVVVNLGSKPRSFSYMDEFMAEGAPYLRALCVPLLLRPQCLLLVRSESRPPQRLTLWTLSDGSPLLPTLPGGARLFRFPPHHCRTSAT
jgi:hypothetical protein